MPKFQIALLAALAVTSSTAQQCYYPDGSSAGNDVPCTSDVNTWCCGKESICLTNGYCINVINEPWTMSAGSCTDATWNDDNCASECVDDQTNNPRSGGQSIVFLTADNGKYEYCCGQVISTNDTAACYIGSPFELDSATMISGRAALANYTDSANTSATATATIASSSSTSSATACPATTTAKSDNSTSHEIAIGAGVGVSLGLVAVASLSWALWERRQRKRSIMSGMMMPLPGVDAASSIQPSWASPPANPPPASELGGHSPMAELAAYHDESGHK